MKRRQPIQDPHVFAANCEACGEECLNIELGSIILRGVNWRLNLCKTCLGKDPLSDYQEVIDIIKTNG